MRIVATREQARALRTDTDLAYFYNPMWRVFGEADPVERTIAGHPRPRPPGTFSPVLGRSSPGAIWRCLDHLLVNRAMMTGHPASIEEATLAVAETTQGASDHCAIGASFRYDV